MRLYAKRSRAIVQPNTEISHRSSNLFSAIEVAETIGTDLETINEWSASYSVRLLGCGCGASVASITRRSLAPWPSSGGDRTRPATNYAPVRVAPVAAAKVQHSSIQAGQAIILASVRFRPTSGDYRGSPENVCCSVDSRSSAAGGKGPFSTAASTFSNCCGAAIPTKIVPIAGCEIANRVAASVRLAANPS